MKFLWGLVSNIGMGPALNRKRVEVLILVLACLILCGWLWKRHQEVKRLAELKARKNMNGLVGWWPGDGDAVDIVSGTHDSLENKVRFTPGISGKAFDFTPRQLSAPFDRLESWWNRVLLWIHRGKTSSFVPFQHVRIADRPALRVTNGMTLSAWIYPTTYCGYQEVMGKWSGVFPDPNMQEAFTLAVVPDGRIYGGVSPTANGTGSESVYGTTALPLHAWTHVSLTYDGAALNIYVNGMLQNSHPYTNDIYPGTADMGIGGVVGSAVRGQSASPFFGKIADASIYNRALTSAEVLAEYEAFRPLPH